MNRPVRYIYEIVVRLRTKAVDEEEAKKKTIKMIKKGVYSIVSVTLTKI